MRFEVRPLPAWTDRVTELRRSAATFRATWPTTLKLLERETEHLGAALVIIQLDIDADDLRRDGMPRARARTGHPGVVVSFTADIGPLRYASDTYDEPEWGSATLSAWQANVRAIALGLQALRAVDRYGITTSRQQYQGWLALPAGDAPAFATADEALRWMRTKAGPDYTGAGRQLLYRTLAKQLHPDARGGDQTEWDRLDAARRLLDPTPEANGGR